VAASRVVTVSPRGDPPRLAAARVATRAVPGAATSMRRRRKKGWTTEANSVVRPFAQAARAESSAEKTLPRMRLDRGPLSTSPAFLIPVRFATRLHREIALPDRRKGDRQAERLRGARHGADLCAGPQKSGF